jgi:hypothetical protein
MVHEAPEDPTGPYEYRPEALARIRAGIEQPGKQHAATQPVATTGDR